MVFRAGCLVFLVVFLAGCGAGPDFNGADPANPSGVTSSDTAISSAASSVASSTQSVGASSSTRVGTTSSTANTTNSSTSSMATSSTISSTASSMVGTTSSAVSSAVGTTSSAASSILASHNPGTNCNTCHKTGGTAAAFGIFTVSGTAYQSNGAAQTKSIVKIYAHNTNTILTTINTDMSGNFYTTTAIATLAKPGVDVELEGPTGGLQPMGPVVKSGACNSCHGSTVKKITSN